MSKQFKSLEEAFSLPTGSTVIESRVSLPAAIDPEYTSNAITIPQEPEKSNHIVYDDKDNEIDSKLDNIYSMAVQAFQIQCDESDIAEGKTKAELAQAASSFLNTALAAVNSKSNMKIQKDKMSAAIRKSSAAGTVNNNLIVTDRNDLLKMMKTPMDQKDE